MEEKAVLGRLLQLYLHDFSEFDGADVGAEGLFEYRYFDAYWEEEDRAPFLILADGVPAGFVLVNTHTYSFPDGEARSIAEFFVMRKYRRMGIGRAAAAAVFDAFPGKWEVFQTDTNVVAQRFWRSVIADYTGNEFTVTMLDRAPWYGQVQVFDSSGKAGGPAR